MWCNAAELELLLFEEVMKNQPPDELQLNDD